MKTCKICNKQFIGNGIKYCSHECAYKAININKNKLKIKKMIPRPRPEPSQGQSIQKGIDIHPLVMTLITLLICYLITKKI